MLSSPSEPPNPPQKTLNSLHLFHSSLTSLSLPIPPSLPPPPPSKRIPNTPFLVDAFSSSVPSAAYFLSHFHSDHYSGLSPSWSHGVVFASPTTSLLLTRVLKVIPGLVIALPLREPVVIDGVEVNLVDANHCPGAVQFLFKVPSKDSTTCEMYVHTGDFRFCGSMKKDRILSQFVGCDAVFLDTTYCNPKFIFPSQEESIDYIVNVIGRIGGFDFTGLEKSNVLFLVATYVVGKERILIEIARRCNRKVHVDGRKMEVLRVLGYEESGLFTEDGRLTDVHVVGWNVLGETWPYFRPNFVKMKEIMVERGYSRVVGFVPTGWTYEVKRNKFAVRVKDEFEIHLVPYSEHSNYDELREYVKILRPKRVIPTVGVDDGKLDGKFADKMRKHFSGLVDEMANKKEFLMGFFRGSSESDIKVEVNVLPATDEGLEKEKEVKQSQMNNLEINSPVVVSNSLTLQADDLNYLTPSDEETEKMLQELGNCLPIWVTQDQKLDLIRKSEMNIVEAVSNFYEHETEFHDQVFAGKISVSASQTDSLDDSGSLSRHVSIECNYESLGTPLTKKFHSSNMKPSVKSGISSPGKRKRNTDKKASKRVKAISKLESGGSKQSTITSFFSKISANVSQGSIAGSLSEKCPVEENMLLNDCMKSYKEEIDQFIRIVDGDESSRSYAANILERTKGDINRALDVHYGNTDVEIGDNVESPVASSKLVLPQSHTIECSAREKTVLEEAECMVDESVRESSTEKVDTTLISLPPEKYDPIKHACWMSGQPAPYIHLARTFDLVEAEKGKIKATSMLCNMFRSILSLSPEDVLPAVYLCTNKIAADHENMELNIGGSLVTSALEEACGTTRSRIKDIYNNMGDLGDVAQVCRQTQTFLAPPPPLLIKDVYSVLRKISVQTGSGSAARKKSLIVNLMHSCREKEIKFIVRTLVRNLRIGAMMRTILPALAQAVAMNSIFSSIGEPIPDNSKEKLQSLSTAVVEAYNVLPNLDLVVPSLINEGIGFSSSTLSMAPGIPVKPMLAKITNGVSQALKLFQYKGFTCEYKYDGQRAQIHKLPDGSFRVFSRNGDETTSRFPDLVNIIQGSCKPAAMAFILDAEVVAIDRKNGCKLMSFQELSSRERGSKDSLVAVDKIKVEICVFIFDIMFANGEQLLSYPLRHRRKYLKDLFCNERLGYFEYAKEITIEAPDACLTNEVTVTKINAFLEDALNSSCEGIMVKSLDVDAGYCPSRRTDTWLKVKRDYVEGLNDSLDLVPIGAWHGNGRKAGWYSPFLMACYNPETEEFQSICRVMSGFSDAFYMEMKEFFSGDRILSKKPPYYRTAEVPDMWFSPELVWEIRGADLTVSPVHQAAVGLVHPLRGISIRFPRYIKRVSDRIPEECSTATDVADMFNSQTRKMHVSAES